MGCKMMKKLLFISMVYVVSFAGYSASLQTGLDGGITGLAHRWRFDGNFNDEIAGSNASIKDIGAGRPWSFGSGYVDLNNQTGDNWNSRMSFVDLPDNVIKNLANTSGYTFELWINTDTAKWNSGYFAFAPENNPGDGTPRLAVTSRENDYFKVSWRQSAGGWYHQMAGVDGLTPELGGFQHVAVVVLEGTDAIAAYVNGVFKGIRTVNPWEGPGLDDDTWWNGIGGYLGTAPDNDNALDGKIYDFRIWTRALTTAEIAQSYALGSEVPTVPQPITNVWPANGGAVRTGWLDYIQWNSGDSYASYDVYLTTDADHAASATRADYCNPAAFNGDIDKDCRVGSYDLDLLLDQWLGLPLLAMSADLNSSGIVELGDFSRIGQDWLISKPYRTNTGSTTYNVGPFNDGKMYYWRIDGVEGGQPVASSPVWSFKGLNKWQPDEYIIGLGWPDIWEIVPAHDYLTAISEMYINIVQTQDFNVSQHNWADYGLRVAMQDPSTDAKVTQFKDNPHVWGYYVMDEPDRNGSEFPYVAQRHLDNHKLDPYKPSVTTLNSVDPFPINFLGPKWSDYYNYIGQYCNQVKFDILVYDHYPYRYDSSPWEEHFGCL